MDGLDASAHYTQGPDDDKPSLLVLILDTNPYAWSQLHSVLPLPRALASILLFLNAHLAFSHANRVAVIASHTKEAVFLYPSTTPVSSTDNDPMRDANKYRQFRIVEDEVQASFRKLMAETTAESLAGTNETMMAGALSLALTYINRLCMSPEEDQGGHTGGNRTANGTRDADMATMNARILVLSVSGDLSTQYVSMMNSMFAAQRKKIPIDICKIAGETVFLQQASDATRGIYMQLQHPESLLQYLMMCFIPDNSTRKHLVPPTQINVDFRAACFCHKRIVDIGFVCSICLSSQCPISSFLKNGIENTRIHGRRKSLELAQRSERKEWVSHQSLTRDCGETLLESSEGLTEDVNSDVTLLVDWWLDGGQLNPGNQL